MTDTVTLSIIGVVGLLITACGAPALLAYLTNKQSRENRQMEWDRQDQLEQRLTAKSDAVAARLEETNAEHVQVQVATSVQLKEIKQVADTVHTLVNSNMTAAMQSDLDANKRDLVSMRRIVQFTKANGDAPLQEDLDAIIATEAKITELSAEIKDRLDATKLANAMKEHAEDPMEQAALAAAEAARTAAIAAHHSQSEVSR